MFWCVIEMSPRDISFMHPKQMFDRIKTDNNYFLFFFFFFLGGGGWGRGGFIFLCLSPYSSNY